MKSKPQLRIGLLGGTFDPPHLGHIMQAIEVYYTFKLDRIVFIPANCSPHKISYRITDNQIRWKLLKSAIKPYSKILSASDVELQRPPPSYTYDTVLHFKKHYLNAQLFWLLGEDQLPRLHTWKQFKNLIQIITFILLPRQGNHSRCQLRDYTRFRKYKNAQFLPWPTPLNYLLLYLHLKSEGVSKKIYPVHIYCQPQFIS